MAVKLDSRLVAQGFDRNRNGMVSDELKIDAPGLDGGDGQVSVDELAGALGRDQVVVSGGIVQARQPAPPADLPALRTMKSVHSIAGQSLSLGGAIWPSWRYQTTRTRSDGSTYTEYDWAAACTELRAKLEAIRSVTAQMPDARSKAIHDSARQAINSYNFGEVMDFLFDGRKGRSDYAALYSTLSSIRRMSETPASPAETVEGLARSVGAAAGAVGNLRGAAGDPAAREAEQKARAKASELRQQAQSIPWWQFLLIFGFFRKMSLNGKAKQIEQNLATLQAADPDGAARKAADLARRAYEAGIKAGAAKNIDDAQALASDAAPVSKEAQALQRDLDGQAARIKALLKAIAG